MQQQPGLPTGAYAMGPYGPFPTMAPLNYPQLPFPSAPGPSSKPSSDTSATSELPMSRAQGDALIASVNLLVTVAKSVERMFSKNKKMRAAFMKVSQQEATHVDSC